MSAESQQALEVAAGDYRVTGDAAALQEAAQGHLAASRELETVLGEYIAVQEAAAAGSRMPRRSSRRWRPSCSRCGRPARLRPGTCQAPGMPLLPG